MQLRQCGAFSQTTIENGEYCIGPRLVLRHAGLWQARETTIYRRFGGRITPIGDAIAMGKVEPVTYDEFDGCIGNLVAFSVIPLDSELLIPVDLTEASRVPAQEILENESLTDHQREAEVQACRLRVGAW